MVLQILCKKIERSISSCYIIENICKHFVIMIKYLSNSFENGKKLSKQKSYLTLNDFWRKHLSILFLLLANSYDKQQFSNKLVNDNTCYSLRHVRVVMYINTVSQMHILLYKTRSNICYVVKSQNTWYSCHSLQS